MYLHPILDLIADNSALFNLRRRLSFRSHKLYCVCEKKIGIIHGELCKIP